MASRRPAGCDHGAVPPTPTPDPLPHGRTARRVQWQHLPPSVRTTIGRRLGSPVASAASCDHGFTPGFASVLTCEDGSRHFVKAASSTAQRPFAAAYRQEAKVLAALPAAAPAPRLLWTLEADDWFVLAIEYVDARPARRPWEPADVDGALGLTSAVAELAPMPWLDDAVGDFDGWPDYWTELAASRPDLPHRSAAAGLAAAYADVVRGDAFVHGDLRGDNLLFATDGRVLACDWNFPARGAAWLDSVIVLVGPRGDGVDVDALLRTHPLTAGVPADDVDVVLALITGYFWRMSDQPVPPTSPHVRTVQRWQGDVCWSWLADRRGWS